MWFTSGNDPLLSGLFHCSSVRENMIPAVQLVASRRRRQNPRMFVEILSGSNRMLLLVFERDKTGFTPRFHQLKWKEQNTGCEKNVRWHARSEFRSQGSERQASEDDESCTQTLMFQVLQKRDVCVCAKKMFLQFILERKIRHVLLYGPQTW